MPVYNAPIRDFEFVLNDYLGLERYQDVAGFSDVGDDLRSAILQEGGRFCEEVLFPLNQTGDAQGLKFENGQVTLPDGFVDAYKQYVAGGWPSFACDPKYGGQGLPEFLNMPVIEMICSANLSFGITPGLSHGAYNALLLHGAEALKKKYLPKITTGEWSGVMCLTEPQCGTDLGLIRTTATENDDGSYAITGTKIFISSGEQDATENIIHLVLAKLPDAPEGTKGISLFVVPKVMVDDAGNLGENNNVACGAIEHKMGIHASPTCVMNYENAKGWLVGTPHNGMKYMFTMMNAARLYVGVQGLGLAEVAYQNALAYAKERIQGRALTGPVQPQKAADPIIVHADVRRMLLTMRAFTEGARALCMEAALKLDLMHRHSDKAVREESDHFIQLMTPIIKAYFTDMGSEVANLAMQVHGGYGYITEYGIEQYVRDARIAQIYEGTNGIQGMDLIGRKLPYNTGRYLRAFFHPAMAFVEDNRDNSAMAEFTKPLYTHLKYLQQASLWLGQKGLSNPNDAAAGAVEYLRMFALVVFAYIWAKQAKIALEKIEHGTEDKEFYEAKLTTARFYMNKILPGTLSLLSSITNGSESVMKAKL
ncbi:MAG: acyl-CoA dehydrogenase C-terminal domain-containing protein [Alphaproteobacteria bacterium]|nr:acyl-CoA dehydrogenase C-terminal domain-containing protein [Alphaproteobacteria bacterium]